MPVRDGGPCYVEHGAVVAQASDDCQASGSIPDVLLARISIPLTFRILRFGETQIGRASFCVVGEILFYS